METERHRSLEFRPQKSAQTVSIGGGRVRSKSPIGFLEKLYSLRYRRRNSASNGTVETPCSYPDEKRVDLQKEFQKCKDNQNTRLDLSSSDITSIPPSIRELVQLTELFLYKNKLTTLPAEIGNLVSLRKLGLSENYLTALPDSLAALVDLQALDLRHNRLNEIPPVIYHITSLETLWLRYNRITNVDEQICLLRKLKMLDLRENKIQALPYSVGSLQCLLVLLCSYNHLRNVPCEIGQCAELSQLDFQHNELSEIPESVGYLRNLTRLGLRYNKLTAIPASLSNCTKLEEFNIEGNNLSYLPEGMLSRLSNVSTINLSRNDFAAFPQGGPAQFTASVVRCRVWLYSLKQFGNQMFVVQTGSQLGAQSNWQNSFWNFFTRQTFDHVEFEGERIDCIAVGLLVIFHLTLGYLMFYNFLDIGTWKSLVELNLSTNQLRLLPDDIDKLQNLEILIMSNNYIKRLPSSIGNLKKLRELDLEENELESLPNEIGFLLNLTKLLVQSNKLTSLPRTIGNLVSLKDLRAGENNLTYLPEEIGKKNCFRRSFINIGNHSCAGTLENLKSLYINDNPSLHTLPYELALCGSLEIMSIENCPLSQIPAEITAGGPSLVIQFLKMQGPYRGNL
ncbi:Leucine-rich repeat protein soc-2 [Trichinella britovi]|uniref:Leucine-rich repeat protein soc-2 n=1 Tax=Trichinella britovi TaxID=45882 RepID=A0A0V1D7S9_TRIBR|nr:Leucine-rich repeat protein soc-2 [Trichinella britovi]